MKTDQENKQPVHDPLAALFFCHVPKVRHVVVDGRSVVRNGELQTVELPALVAQHNRLAAALLASA